MTSTWLPRFGAICAILLGLSIAGPALVEAFTGETAVTSFVLGLGTALGTPALTVLYLHQAAAGGRFGLVAYAVNVVGLGLFAGVAFTLNLVLFYLEPAIVERLLQGPTRAAFLAATAVFVAGTVLFAVSMARSRIFPRPAVYGYGVALPLLAVLAPLPDTLLTSAVHVVAGASLIWLALPVLPRRTAVVNETA
ncbi:hypothetical protein HTZ77_11410 [Nonomuraea sp. SMC257]|uniref:DUF4386 domain-containing protein n=1 Tax=Nonomuraea montanisoli TaxID=2741721 RepID=A0A7Y6I6E2_9ACTN|nr:hypothetical protein [Nonomuraea montanisoli]NUW32033.1 hypothetical protein [Nonomuraea montanisoli]